MAKKLIGKMLGHPIVTGDRNLVRPNEIYAITDAESDDVVAMQMMSVRDGRFYDILRYTGSASQVRTITTDENPAGDGSSVVLETKDISSNGTYTTNPGRAWSKVTVAVPGAVITYGDEKLTISGNIDFTVL